MARPHDMDYLQPDEHVQVQTRRHVLSAVDGFLGIGLLWSILMGTGLWLVSAVDGIVANVVTALVLVTLASGVGFVLLHWRRATSLFTVTEERVYMAYGRLRFHLLQTTYDKVTDLHVHQSVFGRVWGYGTVRVQTAGTGLVLAGVADPLAFKQALEAQRSRFLRSLVKSSRSRAASSDVETPETRWTGTPAAASLVGGLLLAGVMAVAGVVFLFLGLFVQPGLLLAAVGAWVAAGAAALAQWVVFRFTAYEVSTRGVVVTRGWLSRRRVEATFAKVTDVSVDQDLLARLLGYGRITINTAGSNEAPVVFAGIHDPDGVKAIIDAARAGGRP